MQEDFSRVPAPPRLHGLDYLRGLSAFGIMMYHYASWTLGEQAASSFLGRVGIYGVAIFYVLSGQTLSYIYSNKLLRVTGGLWKFYKKRFFRIFPLLWLATILSIVLSKHIPNSVDVFLNLTGLFGLIKWDVYFATGAWSIGNELVFYLTFPFIVFLLNKKPIEIWLLVALVASISIYFAFWVLQPSVPLAQQWRVYTNPFNQLPFFLGGALLGKFVRPNSIKLSSGLLIGAIGLGAFLFLPIQGNAIELVTGPNRILFSACCFLLCYSLFATKLPISALDKPLMLLGQASYSLYLLHPLVYAIAKSCFSLVARHRFTIESSYLLLFSTLVSLIVSYLSFKYFESFFIRLSHKEQPAGSAT